MSKPKSPRWIAVFGAVVAQTAIAEDGRFDYLKCVSRAKAIADLTDKHMDLEGDDSGAENVVDPVLVERARIAAQVRAYAESVNVRDEPAIEETKEFEVEVIRHLAYKIEHDQFPPLKESATDAS